MKKILVMGVNGTFGRHTAKVLLDQGYDVKAMMRDPQKLPKELAQLNVVQGDVQDLKSLERACIGIDIIIYGVNPANYDWDNKVIPYLDHVIEVAEKNKIAVIFPGNVYVFNPEDGPEFNETSPQNPITKKGQMREIMENKLQKATERGLKVVILRMGNFIAPDSQSSWLPHLIKTSKNGYTLLSPSVSPDTKVNWTYVPDAANVIAQLLPKLDQLPNFNVFHFAGFDASLNDFVLSMRRISGKKVVLKSFPWWFFKLASSFSNMFRGILEMRYLWDKEVHLSDTKLKVLIGTDITPTNLDTALLESRIVRR